MFHPVNPTDVDVAVMNRLNRSLLFPKKKADDYHVNDEPALYVEPLSANRNDIYDFSRLVSSEVHARVLVIAQHR